MGTLIEILEKADYRVRVRSDEDGILARFPANHFLGRREDVVGLYVQRGETSGILFKFTEHEDRFIEIAEFAIRPLLNYILANLCDVIAYPTPLIEYSFDDDDDDEEEPGDIYDLVGPPDDCPREAMLEKLIEDGFANGFTRELQALADSLGCGHEYGVCQNVICGEDS